MSTSGRTWGKLAINNGSLMFTVDGKLAMDVPLRDVSQAQVWGYLLIPGIPLSPLSLPLGRPPHGPSIPRLPYNPLPTQSTS